MSEQTQELDWKKAEEHLIAAEKAYGELVGMPDVNPFFALGMISAARRRFDGGERTPELHQEIMEISL